jgi:hypothetical protein
MRQELLTAPTNWRNMAGELRLGLHKSGELQSSCPVSWASVRNHWAIGPISAFFSLLRFPLLGCERQELLWFIFASLACLHNKNTQQTVAAWFTSRASSSWASSFCNTMLLHSESGKWQFKRWQKVLGVVVHFIILALGRLGQGDYEFEVSLGYIMRSCFKKKNLTPQTKPNQTETKRTRNL